MWIFSLSIAAMGQVAVVDFCKHSAVYWKTYFLKSGLNWGT